jgi:hypothetical protein
MLTHVRIAVPVLISLGLAAPGLLAPPPKPADKKVAVAYVYESDEKCGTAFKKLLDGEGFPTDLVVRTAAPKADWSKYGLVVIASDTEHSEWKEAAAAIEKSGRPVLGLGEGGYAFFGRKGLKLDIGAPHGSHGNETTTVPVDAANSPLWKTAAITGANSVKLYETSGNVAIYSPKPPAEVVLLGREERSTHHYTLIRQGDRSVLWGYTAGPDDMTADGRKLFVATCRYTVSSK